MFNLTSSTVWNPLILCLLTVIHTSILIKPWFAWSGLVCYAVCVLVCVFLYVAFTGSKHSLDRDEVSESPKCKKSTHGKKSKVKQAAPAKVKPKKVPWTDEERAAVMRHLGNYIIMQKLPGKEAIQAVIIKENCLKNRTWKNIKDFVRNRITSKARKSERNYMY